MPVDEVVGHVRRAGVVGKAGGGEDGHPAVRRLLERVVVVERALVVGEVGAVEDHYVPEEQHADEDLVLKPGRWGQIPKDTVQRQSESSNHNPGAHTFPQKQLNFTYIIHLRCLPFNVIVLNIHQILKHLTSKNLTFNVFVSNRPQILDHLTLEILNI